MSRSPISDRRAQTEPLAALVAVSAMAIGLAIYGGYLNDVLYGTDQRSVEDPTSERIREMIETNGVFDPSDGGLEQRIDGDRLPQGFHVYVNITVVNDDGRTVVIDDPDGGDAEAYFGPDGEPAASPDVDLPSDATIASRPISIRREPGIVVGGTVNVVVWQ